MLIINGPTWFGKYDVLFNIIFLVVSISISVISYKIYNLTKDKKYSMFGLAFLLVAIGASLYSLVAGIVYTHIWVQLINVLESFDYAFLLYVLFSVIAYALLLTVLLGIESRKVTSLILILALLIVLFSRTGYLKYHITLLVLLGFIAYQLYQNYKHKKTERSKLVFVSFYLLAVSQIFFSALRFSLYFYVVGSIVQLFGALLLFYVLWGLQYERT